jgi:inhibitor of KinA sporulation pathway (predicted exonuclease)
MSSKLPLQSSSLSSPGSPSRSRQYSSNSRKGRESVKEQAFEYFVILDFEGTCESNRQLESVEIIEFPALLIQVKNEMQIKDQFHSFVRPTINEQLSGFCVNLTGITQETVDESPTFTQVFQAFQDWMKEKKLVDRLTNQPLIPFAFITCGNWDLSTALTDQCQQQQLLIPGYMKQWIDFKQEFFRFSGQWPKGLMDMMHRRNLTPIGRHHSGIDDCRNLHLLVKDLASNGHVFRITNQMR